jgi:peptide deformylase
MYVQRKGRVHVTMVGMGKKEVSYILSGFVALALQHAMRMRRTTSFVACPALQMFPHYVKHGMISGNSS